MRAFVQRLSNGGIKAAASSSLAPLKRSGCARTPGLPSVAFNASFTTVANSRDFSPLLFAFSIAFSTAQ